ncbi:hypothetical protein MLD38_019184 [Melastoma candidum]|uniref:Uncharacterized protein n=1 Tax=Melastoma candidum TaxID=119954 RepID=A0ACB9QVL7_9MYRT|nr:hypothetical protein MLD38_019184 [Melastoma candidum]
MHHLLSGGIVAHLPPPPITIISKGNAVRGGGTAVDRVQKTPRKEGIVLLLHRLAPALVSAIMTLSPTLHPPESLAQTADIQRGATLFRRACIGCHDAGGNIIQPGATLFVNDLQRNGVDSEEGIYGITYYGKGRMPGFGENCTPKGQCTFGPRLQEEEIRELAKFVKLQADQGWQQIETGQD